MYIDDDFNLRLDNFSNLLANIETQINSIYISSAIDAASFRYQASNPIIPSLLRLQNYISEQIGFVNNSYHASWMEQVAATLSSVPEELSLLPLANQAFLDKFHEHLTVSEQINDPVQPLIDLLDFTFRSIVIDDADIVIPESIISGDFICNYLDNPLSTESKKHFDSDSSKTYRKFSLYDAMTLGIALTALILQIITFVQEQNTSSKKENNCAIEILLKEHNQLLRTQIDATKEQTKLLQAR